MTKKSPNETNGETFLLQEYEQIMSAYNNSHNRRYEMLKLYITLVTLPTVFLTFITNIPTTDVFFVTETSKSIFLLVIMASIGFIIFNSLISIRITQVLYAKAINSIRRYYAIKNQAAINNALILPKSPDEPRYYVRGSHFFDCLLIGFVNSILMVFISNHVGNITMELAFVIFLVFLTLHWVYYRLRLYPKDIEWCKKHNPINKTKNHPNNIHD